MLKYEAIEQEILERIATGEWAPGALIPSEPELCRHYGVSRTTVRKAVGDLTATGRLVAVQGRGTFVAQTKVEEHFVQRAWGLYEDMARRGLSLSTRVVRHEIVGATAEVARRLNIRRGTDVHEIVRLRFVRDEPIVLSTTFVPYSICPDIPTHALTDGSLYALLRKRGLSIARGTRRLEAFAAGQSEARSLDVALGSPLLQLQSVAYLPNGMPFEFSIALQRGDRAAVDVEFVAAPEDLTAHDRANMLDATSAVNLT